MNQTQAQGFLVAHAVNDLLGREPDEDFPGCCIVHCGACAALHWLRENNRYWADTAVIACYGKGCWDWQERDGRIDWAQLTARWDAHKGCSSVNGVHKPCVEHEVAGCG